MSSMLFQQIQKAKMGASGPQMTKGVGGYRPTVNWRDISVRKKNVADKQVLACIVASGIIIIVLGTIITILGFLVISSQCPFEWVEGSGSCYYFTQHNATWEDGKFYCQNQGATLLDIHSSAESSFIIEKMEGRSWLGLQRKKGAKDFTWISGAKKNFTPWQDSSIPTKPATTNQCGVVQNTGEWVTDSCDNGNSNYVICEYAPGYNPFVLIGPVVIFCGVIVLILSIEVCVRRREFMEKNPEIIMDDDDDRQVDDGLINYGYGNFDGEEGPPPSMTGTKTLSWPPMGSSTPKKLLTQQDSQKQLIPSSSGIHQVTPIEDTGTGPRVHVVPASLPSSPSLAAVPHDDNTQSQEQLELLLSPKTLE